MIPSCREARRPPRHLAALGAALLALTALPTRASAYCQTSTCPPDPEFGIQGAICDPPEESDCGAPLRWERDCVGFTFHEGASGEIPLAAARKLLIKSFATWESADCGSGGPGIHAVDMGSVECDQVEYESSAGNANILVFRDGGWEENGYDKLALTTVNFDKETGEIWNADIEVNTADYDFIQSAGGGEYDLQGVLTHEVGHFLGLAHTTDGQATMFAAYHEGMPDLSEDDILGICSMYPPRSFDRDTCNPIPRHGFSPRCANQQTEGRCSVSGLSAHTLPGEAPLWPIALALGLSSLRLRLRRSRRPRRA